MKQGVELKTTPQRTTLLVLSAVIVALALFCIPKIAQAGAVYPVIFNGDYITTNYSWVLGSNDSTHIETFAFSYTSSSASTVCQVGIPLARYWGTTSTDEIVTLKVYSTTSSNPGNVLDYPNTVASMNSTLAAQDIPQYAGTGITPGATNAIFTLPVCMTVEADQFYTFQIFFSTTTQTTTNKYVIGNDTNANHPNVFYARSAYTDGRLTWIAFPQPPGRGEIMLYGIAGAGITQINLPALGVSTSSITLQCPDLSIFTPLCDGVLWLFVPRSDDLYTTVSTTIALLKSRFPFSYIASIQGAIINAEAATSSYSPTIQMDFSSYSTNTSFGTFLPNITVFSTSTVQQYIPSPTWTFLKLLLSVAVYVETGYLLYWGVLRLFSPHEKNTV